MATKKGSENRFPRIRIVEAAEDSDPTPTGELHIMADEATKLPYVVDDAGLATPWGGAAGTTVATDTIWDAAGDLAVGSGANTAARLAIGATNGMALMRVGGAVAWALPPGHELDYVQYTSPVTVSQTVEASADTIVTANAVTFDGSTVALITFFAPSIVPDNTAASRQLNLWLFDGSSSIGRIGILITPAAASSNKPVYVAHRLTPSAASHTYSIRATVNAGNGTVSGAGGGAATNMPGFIRIQKV